MLPSARPHLGKCFLSVGLNLKIAQTFKSLEIHFSFIVLCRNDLHFSGDSLHRPGMHILLRGSVRTSLIFIPPLPIGAVWDHGAAKPFVITEVDDSHITAVNVLGPDEPVRGPTVLGFTGRGCVCGKLSSVHTRHTHLMYTYIHGAHMHRHRHPHTTCTETPFLRKGGEISQEHQ